MFQTWLTEALGIKYPLIQGAMMWLARAELAAAVSNAGALGILTAAIFPTGEAFRQEIRKLRQMTDKPFAVNIALMPARHPIDYSSYIGIALEEGVSIIETAGRSPEPYVKLIRQGKVKHLHKVARLRDALTAERLGADAVTVVGFEAGGHPGMEDVGSLVLLPRAVDLLKIPVIGAGGFWDGRGLVAALALGAQGVQMGTRFMLSRECPVHPKVTELMLQAKVTDTLMVMRSINNAGRVLRTDYALKVAEIEQKGATLEELLPWVSGAKTGLCLDTGGAEGILYCGQAIGSIDSAPPVRDIVAGIMQEAARVAGRIGGQKD
ncbi:MAG: nitronate monooxygenase [Chloroflexi bacterium]|nr:nitronate monooxygenase [Chloroflexota bacterium]